MEAIRSQVAGQGVAFGTRMRTKLVAQNAGKVKDAADLGRPFSRVSNAQKKYRPQQLTEKSKPQVPVKAQKCDLATLLSKRQQKRVVVPKLPTGVRDIDANVTDPFLEPTYAEDVIRYLRTQERKFKLPTNHLDGNAITSHMRRVLVDWLLQVQDHKGLQQETLHLAITFLDHFLHRQAIPVTKLQLAGVTCLLIAAKYTERFAPEIDELAKLTDNAYTRSQIIRMEQVVLRVLNLELHMPEPSEFLGRFLQIEDDRADKEVVHLTCYLLDLSLLPSTMVSYTPSMKAAAALALARVLVCQDMGHPATWSATMAHYTGYTICSLRPLMKMMLKGLLQSPSSKQTGAMTKYSSQSRHLAVAKWMARSQAPTAVLQTLRC